jgi:DNA-binding transcriptional LysR family regulator
MQACLKKGFGFTICPETAVAKALGDGSLARISAVDGDEEASLVMIWHAEKWCSPLLRHFMQLSQEAMAGSTAPGDARRHADA